VAYIRQILTREFTAHVSVASVSVKPDFDALFQQWRETELAPVMADQDRERQKAAARKTAILRSNVEATLRRWSAADFTTAATAVDTSRSGDVILQTAAGEITVLERRIDEMTLQLPHRTADVLARAANLIDRRAEPRAALGQAFREITGETARDIAQQLEELARGLMAACRRVSSSVQWAGESDDTDSGRRLREVPVPELPPEIDIPSQGVERLLGHGLARSIVAKRLEHAVGDAIRSTLESYAAVLRRWALDNLQEIRVTWAATTDALRADIDRQLGHRQSAAVSPDEIQQDLQRLAVTPVR
jgi:hypothetical protein